jgi:hypothetical protein
MPSFGELQLPDTEWLSVLLYSCDFYRPHLAASDPPQPQLPPPPLWDRHCVYDFPGDIPKPDAIQTLPAIRKIGLNPATHRP